MRTNTAIELIDGIVYKPEWRLIATDHSARFENTICLEITYPAMNSDREEAPWFETPVNGGAKAKFAISVAADAVDANWLYSAVAHCIMDIEEHEMREFLRIRPNYWAPFHPHNYDGIRRWAELTKTPEHIQEFKDHHFGVI